MFRRFWVMFVARNREFFRDRAGFGWNILFPFLLVAGFGVIFGAKEPNLYKIGVYPVPTPTPAIHQLNLPPEFVQTRYLQFVGFQTFEAGLDKLRHHRIDFLVQSGHPPYPFWVSDTNPKGYLMERIFKSSLSSTATNNEAVIKKQIQGRKIRYIDWLFPLTHLLKAIRRVMNDGASLIDVGPELIILLLFTGVFLGVGAALFSWNK